MRGVVGASLVQLVHSVLVALASTAGSTKSLMAPDKRAVIGEGRAGVGDPLGCGRWVAVADWVSHAAK